MPDPSTNTGTPELGPKPKLPPPLAGGRYQLEKVIGAGGMAAVYLATDTMLQVKRAVKILAPRYSDHDRVRQRFLDEARTMARLRHPNIVTVFDVGMEGARPFIVMELIEGGSLMDYIELHGPADPKLAIEVMVGVLGGIGAAHDNGVIHRDIKPHNVLLADHGVPKVTDFGIARVEDRADSLTKTGAMMGTLAYMAPEQRRNARGVGAGADIYAAGATLYVMVTGRDPFDLYSSDLHDEVYEGVEHELAQVLKQACRYRPEHRFRSVAEFQRALNTVTQRLPEVPEEYAPVWGPMFRGAPTHDGATAAVEEARLGATAVPAYSSMTFDIDSVPDEPLDVSGRIGDTASGTLEGVEPKPLDSTQHTHAQPLERKGTGTLPVADDSAVDDSEPIVAPDTPSQATPSPEPDTTPEPKPSPLRWLALVGVIGAATAGGLWWTMREPVVPPADVRPEAVAQPDVAPEPAPEVLEVPAEPDPEVEPVRGDGFDPLDFCLLPAARGVVVGVVGGILAILLALRFGYDDLELLPTQPAHGLGGDAGFEFE